MNSTEIEAFYMTVYTQTFSPDGIYLVACNNYGELNTFNVETSVEPDNIDGLKPPFHTQALHKNFSAPIYCSISIPDYLLLGNDNGQVLAIEWNDLLCRKSAQIKWKLNTRLNEFDNSETNCMKAVDNNSKLLTGCGNNTVQLWDLETRQVISYFKGHVDYVHDLCLIGKESDNPLDNRFASASEDGSVLLWDLRTPSYLHKIEPFKEPNLARPEIGKWVKCLAFDSTGHWLICGGGVKLSTWHIGTLSYTTIFEMPEDPVTYNTVQFVNDETVISGCSGGKVATWDLTGGNPLSILTTGPKGAKQIYSIVKNHMSNKENFGIAIGGSSRYIDFCSNPAYSAFKFKCNKILT